MEANFDGLVGPTHNYGGLSVGNLASIANEKCVSNPKEAALQGLEKMKMLADLGFVQGVLPPQERPFIPALKRLGFTGSDEEVLAQALKQSPLLLEACSSASSMWTANAATVSPGADCADGRTHFTPANLVSKLHRSLEPPTTARALKAIFPEGPCFAHHEWLPQAPDLGDEGAANHTRFCVDYEKPGIELFVYGRRAGGRSAVPKRFPARQAYEASTAVARLHGLDAARVVFAQQAPEAIDHGAFHNDVVSVGNLDLFFYHERAFLDEAATLRELDEKFSAVAGAKLRFLKVADRDVPLADAVKSYLFNSQLVRARDGRTLLIAPQESFETESVRRYLDDVKARTNGWISEVIFKNLRQSMRNGGGPACLRLRVALDAKSRAAVNSGAILDDVCYSKLVHWVNRHYRDRIQAADLADPKLLTESRTALDELTQILQLGSIYPFQGKVGPA